MATVLDAPPEVRLPDHYEVVYGRIVELPPMSFYAREVAAILNNRLTVYLLANDIGRSRVEMQFRIPQPDDPGRDRQPDAVFVSYDRWPRDRPLPFTGRALDVVPDLCVEVVSPTDGAEDVLAKAHEYLRAGARLVWVVFPGARQLYAYDRPDTPPRLFTAADDLDGGDILPGFTAPMAVLFPPRIAEPEPPDE